MNKIHSETEILLNIILLPFFLLTSFSKKSRIKIKKTINILFETKITTTLILINILFFILEIIFPINLNQIVYLKQKYCSINLINYLINIILTWFLHANITHLASNMLFLFVFGRVIEKYLKKKYLLIYFSSALISSLISIFFHQYGLGASGAISGLIITAIFIKPLYISYLFIIPLPLFLIGWINIYSNFTGLLNDTNSNIGYLAHLGGYLGAMITSFFFIRKEKYQIKKGILINILFFLIFLLIALIS